MNNWNRIFKPIVVLGVICVVVTGALAATNSVTGPIITAAIEAAETAARTELLPEADSFTEVKDIAVENVSGIYTADNGYNFMESIVCAAGAGIGFMVAMVLFSGVRRKVEEAVTPKCFEGLPITLVSAAVTSLSFMGFGGIIESIFHV